jgi:hypothetical protein
MSKRIILIALVLIVIFLYILYEEFMSQIFIKKLFLIDTKSKNFRCWSYYFLVSSLPSECNNQSTLEKGVESCRERLNEIYRNYSKSKNWNETELLSKLIAPSFSFNMVETSYSNLKDIVPQEKGCENDLISYFYSPINYEEVDKMLMTTEIIALSTIKIYWFSTTEKLFFNLCLNITNSSQECVNKLMNKLEIIARNISSQIPPFHRVELPKCPQTISYIHVKDLEKEIREQLNKSEDPLSILLKSLDIQMYLNCSKDFYENTVKNVSCPIIPTTKLKSFEIVEKSQTILTACYSEFLKENLKTDNTTLIVLNFETNLI